MERLKMKRYIENYINELERAIHHPILARDIGQIVLDAPKAFFILLPMLNGERWTEQMHTAAIAVGAVHTAFDAHDAIDKYNATSTRQQLTVLSGDYFSGIHYRLLTSLSDFGLIRSLSSMIGEINEMKTMLHANSPDSPEQLIDTVRTIEAGCISDFLHAFGFSQYVPIADAVLPLLWMESGIESDEEDSDEQDERGGFVGQVKNENSGQAKTMLRAELYETIAEANFIAPFLLDEIHGMTTPLLGKLI